MGISGTSVQLSKESLIIAAGIDVNNCSKLRGSSRSTTGAEDREGEENESDLSDDRDPSPTPQPWDSKRTSVHLRVTLPNRRRRD